MKEPSTLDVVSSTGPPVEDLAREGWLLDRAAAGAVTLFATSWEGPVVVLGYAQDPATADLELCRARGIPVLRRLTGGTGVVHRRDLGIGLAMPQSHHWATGIVGLYDRFLNVLEPALRSLGARVTRPEKAAHASRVRSSICFLDQLADTLMVDGRKAVGCAQTRRRGAVLIHAAVLLGLDAALYAEIFGVPEAQVCSGLAPALEGVGWREVAEAIVSELTEVLGVEHRPVGLEPLEPRYLEPYATDRWAPLL
jgi:lipoate-protein ligase A